MLLCYLLLGIVTGFFSGLLGIGGGVMIVPILSIAFSHYNIDSTVATHLAIGTSFATMICTGFSSAITHHTRQAVVFQVFLWAALGLILGSISGGFIASLLSGHVLKMLLGIFIWCMAISVWRGRKKSATTTDDTFSLRKSLIFFCSILIGCVSAIFGIGGGAFNIPFFCKIGLPIQKAVGTSSACSLAIAFTGAITFMLIGMSQHPDLLPKYASGYVYWPAFICIVIGSMPSAYWGAKYAQRVSSLRVRKIFAIFMLCMGCEMIFEILC